MPGDPETDRVAEGFIRMRGRLVPVTMEFPDSYKEGARHLGLDVSFTMQHPQSSGHSHIDVVPEQDDVKSQFFCVPFSVEALDPDSEEICWKRESKGLRYRLGTGPWPRSNNGPKQRLSKGLIVRATGKGRGQFERFGVLSDYPYNTYEHFSKKGKEGKQIEEEFYIRKDTGSEFSTYEFILV